MPCQAPSKSTRIVSVTSREESGRTSSSAWKSRMRRERAEAGKSAPSRKARKASVARQTRGKRIRTQLRRGVPRDRMPAESIELGLGGGRRAEADARNFALGGSRDFEEFARFEIAHASDDIGRKLLDAGVEVAHGSVVIAARVLQRVFDLVQGGLELAKILGRAELRVGFREREELAQGAGQHAFGLALGRRTLRGHSLIAGGGDGFERAAFVGGVAFHGFDEIGDEVIAALELHVDIGPGVIALHAEANQSVVEKDNHEGEHGDDNQHRHHLAASSTLRIKSQRKTTWCVLPNMGEGWAGVKGRWRICGAKGKK